MRIFLVTLSILIITQFANSQNLYQITGGNISFFSETPVEDIDAKNEKVKGLINSKTNDVAFVTTIIGFKFKKPLMEEHFNENYMESDKYKTASFKGQIVGDIDYKKEGKYPVKAKGKLNIHGVEKEREIDGIIEVTKNGLNLTCDFSVKVADHDIEIPKLVVKNIAEIIEVKVVVVFEEKK